MARIKPFVLFSILMLIKSYLTWLVIFGGKWSWAPLVTEIPFVWLCFCLIEMFASKRKLGIYIAVNLVLTAVFFAAIMYYKYYGVIVTYHALKMIGQVTEVKSSVISLMHPYYLFIFLDIVVMIGMLFRRRSAEALRRFVVRKERRAFVTVVFAASLVLCLFNIVPNQASMSEFKQAESMGILNYEAYTILARREPPAIPMSEITQTSIDALKGISAPESPAYKAIAEKRNIIVIQLESLQNFLIDLKVDGVEVTPVLNRLAKEHFYFSNFYQQVGPGNTSDAEFVVNTSYYVPKQGAATQTYATKAMPSLPKLLKSHGYFTATFHTNEVQFWNRDDLYASLGFDRYYDKSFFGEEDLVFFGASDEVLYDKTAGELERIRDTGKPFYAQIVSMSSHHPFTIPPEKSKITIPDRYRDTFVGDYLQAQSYTDYALGRFIDRLKADGLWEQSLIVIYGDHLGLPMYSLSHTEKSLMNDLLGHAYTYTDMLQIPLIIAVPGADEPVRFERVGGQSDILPTIAGLAGVSLDGYIHFGQDLLNQTSNLLPQRYYLPSGSFINDKTIFVPGNGFADGTRYPLAGSDAGDAEATEDQFERALKLLHLSDSYVTQLPDKR